VGVQFWGPDGQYLPAPVKGSRGSTQAGPAIHTLGQARNSEHILLARVTTISRLLTDVPLS
jgi:hypothetical protein